jgi:hypothetical protein
MSGSTRIRIGSELKEKERREAVKQAAAGSLKLQKAGDGS